MTGKSHGIREESRAVALQPILTASAVFMVLVWLSVFKQAMRIPLSHDENQFIAAGQLLVVSHTERGEAIRIISARIATQSERRIYEED